MHAEKLEEQVRKTRKRGHPSKMTGFRCPTELLEAAEGEDGVVAQGLIALLDRAVDAKEELGKDWIEVVVRAHRDGLTEGQALGRLVKETIDREKKGKR